MLDKRMRNASREFVPKARFFVDEEGMFVRWKIILPTETLIDILSFCSRRILSKRMQLVNHQFMRICNENIHSLGTVFNLTVATSYRYGRASLFRDYVRGFIIRHCCMRSCCCFNSMSFNSISRCRDRVTGVVTEFNLQLNGVKYDDTLWRSMKMFSYKGVSLTPAEFSRFMQTNGCVRFANLTFENVQEECVIEFFKYLIETTEVFDHCRFFVKFKHTPKQFKAKAQVVHVQQPLDGKGSRKRAVFEEDDSRNVDLDEFIPVHSLE